MTEPNNPARDENTCSLQGRWQASSPSLPPTHSPGFNSGGSSLLPGQAQDSFRLTPPSLAPENGRVGETGWETGWDYCLPSQASARRMCASIASFPLKRPGDNQVDGELSLSLCVSNEVGTKIEDRKGRKEGRKVYSE